ncbi:recombinase family protein [Corynebacterium sp. A21]|uniref:recombinase family protein n=1 Tax=Corynebacterium sp. A21 TaxID=3457318 RepID=UPI003FD694AF
MEHGQILGYARVSAIDQNTDRQADAIKEFSDRECGRLDRLYIDKASGKNLKRPEFSKLDSFARAGDVIIIHSPDRLARSLKDLINQLDIWRERGVEVRFITQLTFDQRDATGTMVLQILGAVAEFERTLTAERRDEGIASAEKRGAYKLTRKITPEQAAEIRIKRANGVGCLRLAADYQVSDSTIYNVVTFRGLYGTPEYRAHYGLAGIDEDRWLIVSMNLNAAGCRGHSSDSVYVNAVDKYAAARDGRNPLEEDENGNVPVVSILCHDLTIQDIFDNVVDAEISFRFKGISEKNLRLSGFADRPNQMDS